MKAIKKILLGTFFLSLFFSCSNVISVSGQKAEDKIGVTVSGGKISFGDVLPEEYIQMIGLYTKYDGSKTMFPSVPKDVTYKIWVENTSNRSIKFNAKIHTDSNGSMWYSFDSKIEPYGTYDVLGEMYDSSGKLIMTAKYLGYVLSENNPVLSANLSFSYTSNGKGKAILNFDFPYEGRCAINCIEIENWEDDGVDINDYFTVSDLQNGHCTICSGKTKGVPEDIPSGGYVIQINFYTVVGADKYYRYSIFEALNIADNLVCDRIVNNGGGDKYMDLVNNKFVITEDIIKENAMERYYIDSESEYEDEKGSWLRPYKTIGAALRAIKNNVIDPEIYTIYVNSGHNEESDSILTFTSNAMIKINPSSSGVEKPVVKRGHNNGPMFIVPDGVTVQLNDVVYDGNKSKFDSCNYPVFEVKQGGVLKFNSGIIKNNKNDAGTGGGILNNGTCVISEGKFSANECENGKAVYFESGEVKLESNAELCSKDDVNDIYLANGNMITFPDKSFTSNCAAYLDIPEYILETPVVTRSSAYFDDNCRKIKFIKNGYGVKNFRDKYGVLDLSVYVAGSDSSYYTISGSDGSAEKPFRNINEVLEEYSGKTFSIYIDGTIKEDSQIKFDSRFANQSIGMYPWNTNSNVKIVSNLANKNVPFIFVSDSSSLYFKKMTIDANNSDLNTCPDKGGVMNIYSSENSITFDNVTLQNGKASSAGGAVYINGKNFTYSKLSVSFVNNCVVKNNYLNGTTVKGCGICAEGKCKITVNPYQSSLTFNDNDCETSDYKGKNFCYDSMTVDLITDHNVKNKKNKETSDGWYRIY